MPSLKRCFFCNKIIRPSLRYYILNEQIQCSTCQQKSYLRPNDKNCNFGDNNCHFGNDDCDSNDYNYDAGDEEPSPRKIKISYKRYQYTKSK